MIEYTREKHHTRVASLIQDRSMRQFIISLKCPKRLSNERLIELLGKMMDIAVRDAEDTIDRNHEDGELFDQDANDVTNITVNNILPLE